MQEKICKKAVYILPFSWCRINEQNQGFSVRPMDNYLVSVTELGLGLLQVQGTLDAVLPVKRRRKEIVQKRAKKW